MWQPMRGLSVYGGGSAYFSTLLPQEVLYTPPGFKTEEASILWDDISPFSKDALAIPIGAAALSVVVLAIHAAWSWYVTRKADTEDTPPEKPGVVKAAGGIVIYSYRLLRLAAVVALLVLQVLALSHHGLEEARASGERILGYGLCGVYAYSTVLALLSVVLSSGFEVVAIRHLCFVLTTTWSVFVYRDVWPLATYTLEPVDLQYGIWLYVYFAVLSIAGVVVPLGVPRAYIPADPKHPSEELHPEQTASIFSRMVYTYLDPLIFQANRVEHLAFDQLPPLPDYDQSANLIDRGLKRIDTFIAKRRHLFFALMSVFSFEYIGMFLMNTTMAFMSFAGPIGVNRLLTYIETGGQDAEVKPWFWILWLLFGPIISALAFQYHVFLLNVSLVRGGAIVTQLVFNHALKIRVKAETEREPVSDNTTAAATPDGASVVEASGSSEAESAAADDGDLSKKKGKQPEASISGDSTSTKVAEEPKKKDKGGSLLGKLNNLVTSDWSTISDGSDLCMIIWLTPLQLTFCIVFLYNILGWSAFVGLGVTALCAPVPGYLSTLIAGTQKLKMMKTDARIQSVTETMSIIRMVKMFGWEPKMSARISKIREEELYYNKKLRMLEILTGISNFTIPFITMISTYGTYSLIMKKELNASIVFSSMSVFDMFRHQLWSISRRLPIMLSAKVSLDRINKFLYETELLDEYTDGYESSYTNPAVEPHVIGFKNASFTWNPDSDGTLTPGFSRRTFKLHIDDELFFKRGHINLIIGSTGSGKTSMLMALLGEMHYVPMGPDSYFNLPRDNGVAYASQESWVQNETIRDNILFGSEYDEERYNKVIDQCGLKRDLELFEAGDMTEVGEKGLTLSGGQKARVTLARAVYSNADILLLDDVLAALDVHTAKWVVDKCFKGDLIEGRTVLLVTHNIALASPIAEFVVAMGKNGRIASQGSLSRILAEDTKLSKEMEAEAEKIAKAEAQAQAVINDKTKTAETKKADGKLVVAEEIAIGHVSLRALKLYFGSMGGKHWFLWWLVFTLNMTVNPFMETFETWYLGLWARQYEEHPASEVSAFHYLSIFTLLITISITGNTLGYLYYIVGAIRASRKVHQKLITSILTSTMRWIDVTPTSRVINRCTQDIQAIDRDFQNLFLASTEVTAFLISKFIAVVIVAPAALIPGFLVGLVGTAVGRLYLRAQLSIKREQSVTQSPILSHFGAAMAGLVSIRAYSAQKAVKLESFRRIDRYTRVNRTFRDVNRWMSTRVEAIGAVFAAGIAVYLVYLNKASASNTGFALNMAVGFCEMIKYWIFMANRMEVQANSLERIQQYLDIDHEPEATPERVPPAYWPSNGNLSVEKLSARYSADGPKVLQDIDFQISSGERVGIVGRTGSGKSSLTLALLRCILTEGQVTFDGISTDKINLDALRSSITIIPQVPELISGTLRQNLDPFEDNDDAVLNDALRAAGLFSLQTHEDEARLTLDSSIASGGGNLSVGQRQIIALARAMVRRSKLLILDEATSAIDNETDNVIQTSLRNELDKDVTLLTVAHRLQTIMDADKIMVLDAGRIVEFGVPKELLKNEKGILRALVDESGDKDNLYAMVSAKQA